MKKLAFIIPLLTMLFLFPLKALAVDFSIDQTQIDAYLQEDGNVKVQEQHTYSFEGQFNGITRTLIPKKGTAIKNFKAEEKGRSLKIKKDGSFYKVYRSGSDESVTITLSYTIENGVEVYSDAAQFYWPFFDKSNESTYHELSITIHPPNLSKT
ncbi:DUF2207 domain-containing protein [Halobacillus salinarum]|uniref:DUF2207 domain-containing protein n=1 Tax=Halobacillus salinarum TaxID=2932257 RepID=UPI0037C19F65